jgi:hypothetical protein
MELVPPSPHRDDSPPASGAVATVSRFGHCQLRDHWVAWFQAQAEVERSYREWAEAPRRRRGERCARYRAALEREDRAAVVLSAAIAGLDPAAFDSAA